MTTPAPGFGIGVNYWPARTAMQWWTRFDADEVAADFVRIAAAGFDSVRIFLTWEAFQPSERTIDTAMLGRLVTVADLAATSGLALMPTLFTGHMSGVNLVPLWALGLPDATQRFRVVSGGRAGRSAPRNWYTDSAVTAAQVRLATASANALAGHPAVWAWDLGNENSNCVVPPSHAAGSAWLEQMSDAIRNVDPTTAITIGLHMEDLEHDRCLGPAEAAAVCDFLTMHGYPIYAPWAAGPTDEHLLGFLTTLTRWLGHDVEVVFTELGLPTTPSGTTPTVGDVLVDEATAAHYLERALRSVHAAGAAGAMVWCYGDYDPSIWAAPPLDEATHERSFGLWRADATPKPAVAVVSAAAEYLASLDSTAPVDDGWIDVDRDRFFTVEGSHLQRLYRRYRAALGLSP